MYGVIAQKAPNYLEGYIEKHEGTPPPAPTEDKDGIPIIPKNRKRIRRQLTPKEYIDIEVSTYDQELQGSKDVENRLDPKVVDLVNQGVKESGGGSSVPRIP